MTVTIIIIIIIMNNNTKVQQQLMSNNENELYNYSINCFPEQLIVIIVHLIAQLIVSPFHDFSHRQIICSDEIQYHCVA
jgi:hypothetical protein